MIEIVIFIFLIILMLEFLIKNFIKKIRKKFQWMILGWCDEIPIYKKELIKKFNNNTFNFNSPATFNYGAYITGLNYVTGPSDQIENLTVECWCKSNSATATGNDDDERIILSFDRSSVFRFGIGKDTNALAEGKPHFGFETSGGASDVLASSYGGDLRDDTWHQVVATFSSSENELKLYYDGEFSSMVTTTNSLYNSTKPWRIGSGYSYPSTPYEYSMLGSISNSKMYHKTLSADEVLQNYNALKSRFRY